MEPMDFDYQDPLAKFEKVTAPPEHPYDYDLFVIGGGSGGVSAARHAA
jgi:hypothetical protein